MKPLTRIRIILFAFMIFGSFANFALNMWGLTVIVFCQFLMALSFFIACLGIARQRIKNKQLKAFNWLLACLIVFTLIGLPLTAIVCNLDSDGFFAFIACFFGLLICLLITDSIIFYKRSKKGLDYNEGIFENFVLFICFLGLFYKNMHWPGANLLFISSFVFGIPFYTIKSIRFYLQHKREGLRLIRMLGLFSIASILLCAALLFKTMHWPGAYILFVSGLVVSLLVLIPAFLLKFEYKGEKTSIFKGLKIIPTQIVSLYVALLILTSYGFLSMRGLAPRFYEARYPPIVKELSESGKAEDGSEASEIIDSYQAFIGHCEENGFLK